MKKYGTEFEHCAGRKVFDHELVKKTYASGRKV
jgi:hypothetical protein